MKIGQQRPARLGRSDAHWLGALVLALIVVLGLSNPGWFKTIHLPQAVQLPTQAEDLPSLVVDVKFKSYNRLLEQREEALQAGVYIPSAQDFVTATMRLGDSVVPVVMRLMAGPANRLGEDEKWSFQVRTRQNQQLEGMQQFYLLDPAINNWLNQWAFARTLEREGVLSARYRFVRLIFNGEERGVYALQEGFGNELPLAQGRPEGVMVEFDADLLWASIAHFQGDAQAAYADPVSNLSAADFQYFEVDTFRDAAIAADPNLSAQKDRAIGLLRALQAGQLQASEVFDVERYARFLALTDLWGATQGTSLVNLRYYYDPTTSRLEPIGFNANALGSDARVSLAAAYDDPALQAALAREAWRVSQPEYLEQLRTELEPEFKHLQQALSAEYGDLEPPWDQLRERQERLRRSLDPVQPVFAYLGAPSLAMSGTLRVEVGNIVNLPVEIVGFDIHGATFLPAERRWLQSQSEACLPAASDLLTDDADKVILRAFDTARAPVIHYACFDIPLAEIQRQDSELDYMQELDVHVAARIAGLSKTHIVLARQGYPEVIHVGD